MPGITPASRTLFETSVDETLAAEWRGARRAMWVMPAFDALLASCLAVMLAWRHRPGRGGPAARASILQPKR